MSHRLHRSRPGPKGRTGPGPGPGKRNVSQEAGLSFQWCELLMVSTRRVGHFEMSFRDSNKEATRNKSIASSNECLTSSNKKCLFGKCFWHLSTHRPHLPQFRHLRARFPAAFRVQRPQGAAVLASCSESPGRLFPTSCRELETVSG